MLVQAFPVEHMPSCFVASLSLYWSEREALITGVAGQDGVYLARHLLSLGYAVVGTLRPGSRWAASTLGRAYAYLDGVTLVDLDQRDHEGWAAVLEGLRVGMGL